MSDHTSFLAPRLEGGRFNDHTIPLELLKDFSLLNDLILEWAKEIFRQRHPERERVPRNFTTDFSLKLAKLSEGSVRAHIKVDKPASQLFGKYEGYLRDARDQLIQAIAAAEAGQDVSLYLPGELANYFNRLGLGLREGEAITFSPDTPDRPARLNRHTRRKLALSSKDAKYFKEEVTVRGYVESVRGTDRTVSKLLGKQESGESFVCNLRLLDGNRVEVTLEASAYGMYSERIAEKKTSRVLVRGIGILNRQERIEKIEAVEEWVLLEDRDIVFRLAELRALRDGWFEVETPALNKAALDSLSETLAAYPDDLLLPYLYPTPEGQLLFEWPCPDEVEFALEIDLETFQGTFSSSSEELEESLLSDSPVDHLEEIASWEPIFVYLRRHCPINEEVPGA